MAEPRVQIADEPLMSNVGRRDGKHRLIDRMFFAREHDLGVAVTRSLSSSSRHN
ncbi:hypothetical protein [Bradyrhizobium sp. CW1]|uniref:hypothetical protein n=1 Tax=Bradyrhizobium sp. CW1 TaxID=2782686 RepID=UPI001FFF58E6|nr:hypothetical protein [Bradyrhizobium sp. CW1]UPJ26335.1 hypothetical protein IVB54_32005 [Bradyrhizobium sp. CW1]